MPNPTAPHHRPHRKTASQAASQDVSQPIPPHSLASDITIVKAIAKAVRATPGVVDLSPGLLALAATYAAHERFVGIVIRHPGPRDTEVEVHVIVAMEAAPNGGEAQGDASSWSAQTRTSQIGVLTRIANQVREAVYRAMQDLHLPPPSVVDVLIDDIQEPA